MVALDIEVVSDVVCPWCWVGKRRLERALAERPQVEARLTWRPFLLHPWLPPEGTDRESLYLQKFGTPRAAGALVSRIEEAGRTVGLDFRFDRIERVPDTTAAHCVLRWAGAEGAALQGELAERLFRAYFSEGRDVGDHGVLADEAAAAGMERDAVLERLALGEDREQVRSEAEDVRDRGVTGVPFMLLGGRAPIMGAQEPATMVAAIDRALAKGAATAAQRA